MKKIICLVFMSVIFSCSGKDNEDPLILPPKFAEVPDLKNPEKVEVKKSDEDIDRLKDLLLQTTD